MQVFLPYPDDLSLSAQSLDDLRLNKQITEINQILLTYVNEGGGHVNHPVNQWYKSNQGITFLLEYLPNLLDEYWDRFKKIHMGRFTYCGLYNYFYSGCTGVFGQGPNPSFKPAYIKGQVKKDQIITTDNVGELYQALLCEKWKHDSIEPKWTGRDKPEFYST